MPFAEDIGKAYETYFTHGDSAVAEARPGLARRVWRAMKRAYIAREFPTDAPSGRLLWLLALPIRLSRFARDQIDMPLRYLAAPEKARMLDVGCGDGSIVKLAAEFGWQAEGVDFDARAVANARRKRLAVRAGALEDQGYPEASFDLVHMSHVIEHVPDPLATLAEIRRVLRPGGLVLATPNSRSWGHAKFGPSWLHLDPPRHLHLFNGSTLHAAAVRTGFGSIAIRSNLRGVAGVLGQSQMIRRSGCGDPYRPPVSLYGFAMATIEAFALRFRPEAGEELLLEARK